MDTTEITVTLPAKEAVQLHIEHLQSTITKRNAEIERLNQRLIEAESGEPNQHALERAYKRGWQAAAGHLMKASAEAAQALGKLRKDAWDIYLKSESGEFDGHQ